MINANELRIGNTLMYKALQHRDIITVVELMQFEILTIGKLKEERCFYYDSEWIEPIPLTPEILKKCGFEKHKKSETIVHFIEEYDKVEYSPIIIKLIKGFDNGEDKWFYESGRTSVKYLHQLQNLYFALTGTELEFESEIKE